MNTIYDNTFVLGETNNLTFEAGPGIKIDQPSEGVVRIGADETVLWENSAGTSGSVNLSEPYSNFERMRIKMLPWNDGIPPKEWEYYPDKTTYRDSTLYSVSTKLRFIGWELSANNNKDTLTFTELNFFDGSWTPTPLDKTKAKFYKVVGINRISGGNE